MADNVFDLGKHTKTQVTTNDHDFFVLDFENYLPPADAHKDHEFGALKYFDELDSTVSNVLTYIENKRNQIATIVQTPAAFLYRAAHVLSNPTMLTMAKQTKLRPPGKGPKTQKQIQLDSEDESEPKTDPVKKIPVKPKPKRQPRKPKKTSIPTPAADMNLDDLEVTDNEDLDESSSMDKHLQAKELFNSTPVRVSIEDILPPAGDREIRSIDEKFVQTLTEDLIQSSSTMQNQILYLAW